MLQGTLAGVVVLSAAIAIVVLRVSLCSPCPGYQSPSCARSDSDNRQQPPTSSCTFVPQARRRRMSGVARLQEVPMPQLAFGSDSQDRYLENQYVVSMNAKLQQGKDLAKPADL